MVANPLTSQNKEKKNILKKPLETEIRCYPVICFSTWTYMLYLHWRSFPRGISQIWLESEGGNVENFRIPPIIWQLVGSYSLNMATLDFLTLIMWRLVLIFPLKKKKPFVPFAPFLFFSSPK
jgi:hypothetical protein